MFNRAFLFTGLLAAALGIPYLSSSVPSSLGEASSLWGGGAKAVADSTPQLAEDAPPFEPAAPALRLTTPQDAPLEGMTVQDLSEVLRFDITPNWVYDRWSRKSTALANLDLYGIRVPLVTGIGVDDLAGSLTYYFSPKGEVEMIVFRGRTGDTRKLVDLLTRQHGFRWVAPELAGETLYQVRWNGKPVSQLRIRPASVIWATAQHATFEIDLDLQRPGAPRYLADPIPDLVPDGRTPSALPR